MFRPLIAVVATAFLFGSPVAQAATEENAEDFMQLHQVEIVFHEAGSTKNLDLMLSLFTDDATLITADGKAYVGKDQVKSYWQHGPQFQPDNQWIGYTPAFRIFYNVQGDNAHLYFECLWVDKKAGKIAAHTNADDELVRVNGRWLIKEMKAGKVEEL
jgi:ketosteroid isomerase-like protein